MCVYVYHAAAHENSAANRRSTPTGLAMLVTGAGAEGYQSLLVVMNVHCHMRCQIMNGVVGVVGKMRQTCS